MVRTNLDRSITQPPSPSALYVSVDELVYSAQSSASGLADVSLGSGAVSVTSLGLLYLAGLLTSFSPCSLGLLPLTMSYISQAAGEREDKAALLPTLAFAAGLASVFCGLGLSVSLLGGVFGAASAGTVDAGIDGGVSRQVISVALSAIVTLIMGLQLLDIVRIPLPSLRSTQLRPLLTATGATGTSDSSSSVLFYEDDLPVGGSSTLSYDEGDGLPVRQTDGDVTASDNDNNPFAALFRTFLLGGSSALLASPCATPVLTSILAFVGASRNPVLGFTLLFTYTAGYSTPLLVVAATGGEALAKASSAEGNVLSGVGRLITPLTGAVLVWYGTNSMLTTVFGDPSLSGLSPVIS